MTRRRARFNFVIRLSGAVIIALAFLLAATWAQNQAPGASQEKSPQSSAPPHQSQSSGQKPEASPSEQTEKKITPQEAQELFRSVDDILKFVSKDTALPVREEVKRRLVDRDEVVAFIRKHMEEDEDSQRLRRSELVLKKFGLLPRTFDLQPFLIALLREQVAGYYDPKTKSVNLLDWIEPEQQKPVLAHELTHALQDQSFDLEKYMKADDLGASAKEPSIADIEIDEATTAHQAVVEGQAMVVLIDYMLAPTGKSITDSPELVEALKSGMLVGNADSVEFHNAPSYIKEALTFPYRYGLDFEAELLTRIGKEKAYAGVFKNPPHSSREIMEPTVYISGEKLPPMPLADFKKDFKNYDKFDIGAMGEFDVALLVNQYGGTEVSKRLYPHWRGGYYYAVHPKADPSAPLGVMYLSRWSSPQKATEFAYIYAKGLKDRYARANEVGDAAKDSKPRNYTVETLTGTHSWLTEEGAVVIEVKGDLVLVTESLDQETTANFQRELMGGAGTK
jgi:hypothetical protein